MLGMLMASPAKLNEFNHAEAPADGVPLLHTV